MHVKMVFYPRRSLKDTEGFGVVIIPNFVLFVSFVVNVLYANFASLCALCG